MSDTGTLRNVISIGENASHVVPATHACHLSDMNFTHTFVQDMHQLQKLQATNQELVAKNLSLQIENEELSEGLAREVGLSPSPLAQASKLLAQFCKCVCPI